MDYSILNHLRGSYAVNGGKIDPWGTFRILSAVVPDSGVTEEREEYLFLRSGLPIWHETLAARYNKGKHRVVVSSRDYIAVVDENGDVVEKIPSIECEAVQLREHVVSDDGHLFSKIVGYEQSRRWLDSIKQIAQGERPVNLDNSMFEKVHARYAGQELVAIEHGVRKGCSTIYTKDGRHVSCKCYYPLSYDKWTAITSVVCEARRSSKKVVFT